jgi:hypothetical protein
MVRFAFCIEFPTAVVIAMFGLWASSSVAQELTPRAYWPAPKGTNLLVVGYQHSSGDIVTDATLPVIGVDSQINYAQLTYQRTLNLFDRSANLQVSLPYTWGDTKGTYEDEPVRRDLSATSDMRFLLSVNLRGAPSMDKAGFQALRKKPKTIIGASVLVQAPTGGYDENKLLNTGTNRWSVQPALGVIWPIRPTWLLEFDLGVWFFGDNDDFLGTTREQDPIYSGQMHVVKRFKPGFWASLDMTYYRGGQTQIEGNVRADLQRNSRVGATLVFPIIPGHAIRAGYSTGVTTSSGGDFDNYILNYFYLW